VLNKASSCVAIVDDDESVRTALRRLLQAAGLSVETFSGGSEFLAALGVIRPHCVVLDLHMPYMDGFSALSLLRKDPMTRDAKIVAITAAAAHYELSAFLEKGFDGLLTKPVSPAELVEAVAQLVKGPKAGG
jgi:CheY-like chemotaxis protein